MTGMPSTMTTVTPITAIVVIMVLSNRYILACHCATFHTVSQYCKFRTLLKFVQSAVE
jgi:hypothetical protein